MDSAEEALHKLRKCSYDVVISEYDMPLMDGITFLKTMHDKGITVPFIIFTIISRENIMSQATESGTSSVIQKIGNPKTQ